MLLSNMTLTEVLKYADIDETIRDRLEEFNEDFEEQKTTCTELEAEVNRLEKELNNYKLFVNAMYTEVNRQTTYKGLKAGINDELDFYCIEV